MENSYSPNNPYSNLPQQSLPNATAVLILGIFSLLGCFCYGLPGLIASIIALVLAKKDRARYAANPSNYTLSSYNNLKAGRVCALICLILFIILVVCVVGVAIVFGFEFFRNPQAFIDRMNQM